MDEMGEMPITLQPKLLRAIEAKEVLPVGATTPVKTDVRLLVATNRDLATEVEAGRFREDLYFRLAAAVVAIPPLRERPDDLPVLVRRLIDDLGRPELEVSEDTYAALRAHPWPGNVRELKNALACALAFVDEGGRLEAHHLRLLAPAEDESALERLPLGGLSLERIERAAIKQTLVYARGNKVLASQALGIAVSTLYEKIKKYCL